MSPETASQSRAGQWFTAGKILLLALATGSITAAVTVRWMQYRNAERDALLRMQREELVFLQGRLIALSHAADTNAVAPRFPEILEPTRPTWDDVNRLAVFYDLRRSRPASPRVAFTDGDIAYFAGTGLSARDLRLEFEARRLALEQAERSGQTVSTPGELSDRCAPYREKLKKLRLPL